jgi:3D (Asp-Asp-Asp) domain-containing protein
MNVSGQLTVFWPRATGYYPDASPLEGGFIDRMDCPLHTLQDYLAGQSPYVSIAMDADAFRYGTRIAIPELVKRYHQQIEFRVVDTGSAFRGQGRARIDICTANKEASEDDAINGIVTCIAFLTGETLNKALGY